MTRVSSASIRRAFKTGRRAADQDYSIAFPVMDGANTGAYYENVNLATPATLRCSIYETIKGHNKYPYSGSGDNTWVILNLADEDPVESSKILDNFRNESFTKITGGTGAYNREHTWPRSYGLGSTGTPGPATDTHMLHLTQGYNSDRGNVVRQLRRRLHTSGHGHNHGIMVIRCGFELVPGPGRQRRFVRSVGPHQGQHGARRDVHGRTLPGEAASRGLS